LVLISASLLAVWCSDDEPDSDTFLACPLRPLLEVVVVAVVAADVTEELPNQKKGMVFTAVHSLLIKHDDTVDDGNCFVVAA